MICVSGVILTSQDTTLEESRTFNGMKAGIGGDFVATETTTKALLPDRTSTEPAEILGKFPYEEVIEAKVTC